MKTIFRILSIGTAVIGINLLVSVNTLASDPIVHQAQQKLIELGYDPGTADGFQGPKTKKVIMQYQKDQNLRVSGALDQKTRESLGIRAVPAARHAKNNQQGMECTEERVEMGGGLSSFKMTCKPKPGCGMSMVNGQIVSSC